MASLKKMMSDYGLGGIIFGVLIFYALYVLCKHLFSKGKSGNENMTPEKATRYANQLSGGNGNSFNGNPVPAEENGNEVFNSVNGSSSSSSSMGTGCLNPKGGHLQNPSDLLPKDNHSKWAELNPSGKGDLANINFLKAGYHIGIDTVGQTLRNANLQIRSEPPNPQVNTGIWNMSTIEPDFMRVPLELGQGGQ